MSEGRNNLQYSDFPLFAISDFCMENVGVLFCYQLLHFEKK